MSNIIRRPDFVGGGITAAEKIQLADHAEMWVKRILRTDPIEPAKIVPAVKALYAAAQLKEPRVVIVPSPLVMAVAGGFASAIWASRAVTRDATAVAIRDDIRAATATAVAIADATRAAAAAATYGATTAVTRDAIDRVTRVAADDTTDDATAVATYDATATATVDATTAAIDDATVDATTAAIDDVTAAATRDATLDATAGVTDAATAAATVIATAVATDAAIYGATADAIDAATAVATAAATAAVTYGATADAIDAATRDATRVAVSDATRDATRVAVSDATRDAVGATRDATDIATRTATDDATDAATRTATSDATRVATDAATSDVTYAATDAATSDATSDATRVATDDVTDDVATDDVTDDVTSGWAVRLAHQIGSEYQIVPDKLLLSARDWKRQHQGGNMWGQYDCYLTGCRDVLGLRLPVHEKYAAWEACAIHGGFRYLHAEFCLVSDFPEFIRQDDQHRPHCADGPSHRWRDGWSLYHWHGVAVPAHWIIGPKPSAQEVLAEENLEKRRAGMEILGWAAMLAELEHRVIDTDPDPQIGSLVEVDLPDAPNSRFLFVRCATQRDFVLSVPQECKTALEANAWSYDLPPDALRVMQTRT